MKKLKMRGDVGVMEVSQSTSLGVRTRAAKTLALQRLNSSFASASASATATAYPTANPVAASAVRGPSCYIELRSRRLEKPAFLNEPKKPQQQQQLRLQRSDIGGLKGSNSRSRVGSSKSDTSGSSVAPVHQSFDENRCIRNCSSIAASESNFGIKEFFESEGGNEASAEASFGENNLDFDTRDRSTRESTPCSIAGDMNTIIMPGSRTRQRSPAAMDYRTGRDNTQRIIPTTRDLEELFVYAEQEQQRLFMEKYNFDVVNDHPLPGRYDWVQVVP